MRILTICLCLAVGLVSWSAPTHTFAAETGAQQNVVLLVVDDLGFQLGCYGDKVAKMPALDRLAAEGTRFTEAFCTTSSCSASRSVLLTGLMNHANGQFGHAHSFHHFRTFDSIKTLPVLLGEAGYRTASVGKFHVAPEAVYHFEAYLNDGVQGNRNTVRMAQNARQWIAARDDRPFFLYFCTSDPHRGGGDGFANFDEPDRYPGIKPVHFAPEEIEVPSWLPDRPEVRRELASFYQAAARLDQGIGVLLAALEETGHRDDTLVIFLSDNGPPFPGAKTNLYEPGMHLPLIVRKPGQKRHGIACDALVTWADITPTILDYAGVKSPKPLHGRSFLPVVETEKTTGWDEAYASHTFHEITMYYPMRVVRTRRYKYILNLAHPLPFPFASDLFASPTWQGVLKRGDTTYGRRSTAAYLQRPRHELYDLESDPDETINLAESPDHAQVLAELQKKLRIWQERTDDPWLVKYNYE